MPHGTGSLPRTICPTGGDPRVLGLLLEIVAPFGSFLQVTRQFPAAQSIGCQALSQNDHAGIGGQSLRARRDYLQEVARCKELCDHFLVLSEDVTADTHWNGTAQRQQENLRRWADGLEQRRHDDIRVENNPVHGRSSGPVARRARRAAAISASISSMDSWSRPASSALDQDFRSQSGAKSRSSTCRAYCSADIPCVLAFTSKARTSASGRLIVKFKAVFLTFYSSG